MTAGPIVSPPRPLTPQARRRSWTEPRVRSWWLAAVVLFGVAAFFAITQYNEWATERRLIAGGALVNARVEAANGIDLPEKKEPPESQVRLSFTYNGQRHAVEGYLVGRKEFIITGRDVPIHIDPNDPERWTAREHPKGLGPELLGSAIILPAVIVAALAALWTRARVLRTWRDGGAHAATVVESRQTSLAPLSRAVACVLRDGDDKRLITVFVPQRLGRLETGGEITIIFPPNQPARALPAMAYQ